MRFADGRRRRRPATLAVLVTLSLVILATLAGASQGRLAAAAKRVPVGGLTAVKFRTIRVAGKRVDPHGNPNSTKEFKSLYAGDRIQATVEGTVWFDVRVGDKAIYCTTRPDGPDPGDLQVSPDPKKPADVLIQITSGKLQCATSPTGGPKTIRTKRVRLTTIDPVFQMVVNKRGVDVKLRNGAAVVSARKRGVVVAERSTSGTKQRATEVVVPAGKPPRPPKPATLQTLGPVEQTHPPSHDSTPPQLELRGRPANPSAQTEVRFVFTANEPGVLFSCAVDGGNSYNCQSGQQLHLDPGRHTFSVRATDAAGNTGTAQSFTWTLTRSPNAPIVFQSDRSGKYELYTIDPDGTGLKQLTTKAGNFDPAWSPNGRQIAFESDLDQANGSEIYVMDADGGKFKRLTTDPATDRTPRWSPDGKAIVFASNRTGKYQIYTVKTDGSDVTPLTSGSENADPAWSPDGSKIAFETSRDGDPEIYVMNADGRQETRLTKNTAGDFNPVWSPDGKKIAFESDRDGDNEIYVMDADGTNEVRLTSNKARDSNPAWSPEGRRIAFSSNRDGNVELYVMNADGTSPKRLTTSPKNDLAPSW